VKYWIMTDLHLGHKNRMIPWCGRPDNYEQRIIEAVNRIPEHDVFICLGDICFGNEAAWHYKLLNWCKATPILVLGNHDKRSNTWYTKNGWSFVCDTFTLKRFGKTLLFSHVPQEDNGYDINIHGHFHNSDPVQHEDELVAIKNKKQILVKIEHDYRPLNLEKIVHGKI